MSVSVSTLSSPQLRASGLIGAFPDAASVVSAGAATRRLALQALHSASPVNGVLSVPHGSGSFVTSVLSLSCHLIRKAEPSLPGSHIVPISPEAALTPSCRMKRVEGASGPLRGWHGRTWVSLSCLTHVAGVQETMVTVLEQVSCRNCGLPAPKVQGLGISQASERT